MRSKIYGSTDVPERLKGKAYAGSVLAVSDQESHRI